MKWALVHILRPTLAISTHWLMILITKMTLFSSYAFIKTAIFVKKSPIKKGALGVSLGLGALKLYSRSATANNVFRDKPVHFLNRVKK